MVKYLKICIKTCCVAVLLLATCFCSISLCAFLPNEPIQRNVLDSCEQLSKEGLYPNFLGFKLFQMDNYTDTIMLFESVTINEDAPLRTAMSNIRYKSGSYFDIVNDLRQYLQGDMEGLEEFEYSRYWHGYLVVLRPLLMLFNYQQIRTINYVIFTIVLFILLYSIWKYIGKKECIIFLASQIAVSVPFVPYNLQFSWTFYIAYFACLYLIKKENKCAMSNWSVFTYFFVIGGLTSFIDLLVTPIITLGLPLIFFLYLRKDESLRKKIVRIVTASIVWVLGYAFIWSSKWVIASMITDRNVILDAINQIFIRTTGSTWKGMELTISNIAAFIINTLSVYNLLIPLVVFAVVAIVVYLLCLKDIATFVKNCWLLLIACMPLVWFFVLREHSIQHGWFTWRALTVTLFAAILFVWNTCSVKVGVKRIKRSE